LFKDAENIEQFERALNDPGNGVNNLDLNNNQEIDFIRVIEQAGGDGGATRLIVLQAVLGENEFQDVATIAVEREAAGDDGKYNLQIQGDALLYGANYYIVPARSNFSLWNVVRWIFRPNYRVYVSPFGYRTLPGWWQAGRRPVAFSVYRTRTGAFAARRNFVATKTVTVRTVNRINYRPRTSTVITRSNAPAVRAATVNSRPVVQTRTTTVTTQRSTVQTTRVNTRPRRGKP
jgi:hypothetical protein